MIRWSGLNSVGRRADGRRSQSDVWRVVQDVVLALLVVIAIFGFATWESRAYAAAVQATQPTHASTSPVILARLSGHDAWQPATDIPSLDVPTFPAHPDILDSDRNTPLGRTSSLNAAPYERVGEFALEDQVFWRHAGRKADQLPWFVADQKKKHAGLTGGAQFLMLTFVFAVMAALTMGFWRQFGGVARSGRPRNGVIRRLR